MTGWIRLKDLAGAALPAERKIALLATAMTELGIAQGLVMIHGRERGAVTYAERGGCIRFDDDGEPVIPADAQEPA